MARHDFRRLNANGTTTLETGGGKLHSVSICVAGASSNTLTLYDNTAASGTVIANINTTAALGTFIFDAGFGTGLTAILATGTAADVTITWE